TIADHPHESRKEWMLCLMERAGKKNGNNNEWQFWQQHNKPLEITSQDMFEKKLEYIHQNPVQGGFNKAERLEAQQRKRFLRGKRIG
ncbi:MAG: hypothetical protein M3040_07425, partial [Bacteroidota bacterium]|nr:hypothetical protein [Bacteroidota bacterium]